MLQSPLRVHLCAVHVFCGTVTADQLLQIFAGCPQLQKLFVEVDAESINTLTESTDGAAPFNAHTWPSSLRTVQFSLRGFGIDLKAFVNVLPPSSDSGFPELTFVLVEDLWMDLAPLFPLSHRTSLFVSQELPESQLSVVKQMRSLVSLSLNHGGPVDDVKDLLALLAEAEEPHQLQRLERISMNSIDLDDEGMQGLVTLPNLTELEPGAIHPSCFSLLCSFSKMRTLHLRPTDGSTVGAAEAAVLLSSLRAMPDLTSFEFRHWAEENSSQSQTSVLAFLQPLLDGLGSVAPQLRELSLSDCSRLPPLHGLRTCTQLRKLKLCGCFRGAASDVGSQSREDVLLLVQSLRHLERIEVKYCNLPLTEAQRTQLMPLCFSWS